MITHLGELIGKPECYVLGCFRLQGLLVQSCNVPSTLTLVSSGLNSIRSVSNMTLVVSTSSTSVFKQLIKFFKAPEATDAGYNFAKLLNPSIAALLSSKSVALCKRPLRVLMVVVAFCFAGAWDSSMRNMALRCQ